MVFVGFVGDSFGFFFGFREIRMILEKRGLCRGIGNAVLSVMD